MGLFDGLFSGMGLGDWVSLAGTAAGIIKGFTDDGPEIPAGVTEAAQTNTALARALLNPQDPTFQRIAGQEEGRIRADFGQALRGLQVADNRQIARTGGVGLLNPERRDETFNSLIRTNYGAAKEQAQANARQYIQQAIQANQGAVAMYAPQTAANQAQYTNSLSSLSALTDLGRAMTSKLDGSSNRDLPALTLVLPSQGGSGSSRTVPSIY